jgi:transposase
MAMGTRKKRERQESLWVAKDEIVTTPGNAFYDEVNRLLAEHGFDRKVEHLCGRYYQGTLGRPSMSPGVYFRSLLIGYFEGLDSERGIAWRLADSLSLRKFVGYGLDEKTPDHSTLSRTRRLFWLSTHKAVFRWVLRVLNEEGLISGQTVSVDGTTLEANAALKSIVRRGNGQGYEEFLQELGQAAGLENPTRADLVRLDRRRKKKGSNQEWKSPSDPDARITKMKDGRTHLAHKAEHAVDLRTGALLAVTVQGADQGDTTTLAATLHQANAAVTALTGHPIQEAVLDKGYHSNAVLRQLDEQQIRSYVPEPKRGRRNWDGKAEEQQLVYANRRRVNRVKGKRYMKRRGEYVERSFAHLYETGGMRRVHLRGRQNILKRAVVQAAGFNLGLVMRKRLGHGKPRQFQGVIPFLFALVRLYVGYLRTWASVVGDRLASSLTAVASDRRNTLLGAFQNSLTSATGC